MNPAAAVVLALAVALAAMAGGCANRARLDGGSVVRRDIPSYRDAAERYNERVEPLGRFRAQATVQFRYTDREGKTRIEQPEGTLQVVRPDRLALSLGKLGQVKFWLGSDTERYWWLDMMDEPIAYVGRHESFNERAARRLGLSLPPLDLIRVLCLTPLDPDTPGATQWSRDGRRLGITTEIGSAIGVGEGDVSRARQRIWVDPANYRPSKIELYDSAGRAVVVAEFSGDERVEVPAGSVRGGSPWIPKSITIYAQDTDATVRLSLSAARNDGVNDRAFVVGEVLEIYGVEKVEDLDAR